jgi:hypothetical protein
VTHEEIEQEIRSVTRRCRGVRRAQFRASDLRVGAFSPDMLEQLQALEVKPGDATAPVLTTLLERRTQADNELAQVLDQHLRVGCGADFNDVILANPLDGDEVDAKCPRCGLAISYRAPDYTAVVAAANAALDESYVGSR